MDGVGTEQKEAQPAQSDNAFEAPSATSAYSSLPDSGLGIPVKFMHKTQKLSSPLAHFSSAAVSVLHFSIFFLSHPRAWFFFHDTLCAQPLGFS